MIYFDSAATTYPKPPSVTNMVTKAMTVYGGNPGRGGYKLSMDSGDAVFAAREKCANFFGAKTENTIFTVNCTLALNMAIKGVCGKKHVIISDLEHNAVLRPVHSAGNYSIAAVKADNEDITISNFERLINEETAAIATTAASNVTGEILPYERIFSLCQKHGICYILDAAQGAGVLPLTVGKSANIICAAGHKGLYGPMGTGLMITDGKFAIDTIIEGGTGSMSKYAEQPVMTPDRFESGTVNTPGIVALGAGIDFVKSKGVSNIFEHEKYLCEFFFSEAKKIPKVILYSEKPPSGVVVPFNINGMGSEQASYALSEYGFCLRGGLHCAYLAHRKLGTESDGALRFAPSVWNKTGEVINLIRRIKQLTASNAVSV